MVTDPEAILENALIEEYLQARGLNRQTLAAMNERDRGAILAAASTYAADKLAEVEARARFLHEIRGDHWAS